MRQHARVRKHVLNALWSPETFRVLFVGLLAWSLSALALLALSASGFEFLPAATLRATALAVGFAVGAAAIVFYGAWRYLSEPHRLAGALGAGAILSLPLLLGILLPALLSIPGAGFDHSARMLELGLLLPLCAHAAFAVARGGERYGADRARSPRRPRHQRHQMARVLIPELLLLAIVLGFAALSVVESPAVAARPFEVAATPH